MHRGRHTKTLVVVQASRYFSAHDERDPKKPPFRDVPFPSTCAPYYASASNGGPTSDVLTIVNSRMWAISLLLVAATVGAAVNDYASAKQKLDTIETGRLVPG